MQYWPKRKRLQLKGIFNPVLTDLSLRDKYKYLTITPYPAPYLGIGEWKVISVIENKAT